MQKFLEGKKLLTRAGVSEPDDGRSTWALEFSLDGKKVLCETNERNAFYEILCFPVEAQKKIIGEIIKATDPGDMLVLKDERGQVGTRIFRQEIPDEPNSIYLFIVG